MAKRALSAAQVASIKADGRHPVAPSLYLNVRAATGSRSWLFRYERQGKCHWLGLGGAADVPLTKARDEAERLRVEVRQGQDPLAERKTKKAEVSKVISIAPTFAWCAAEYIAAHEASWKNDKHIAQWTSTLATYVKPIFGSLPVDKVEVEHVLKALKPIWITKPETASRLRGRIERIIGYASAMGHRSGPNPAEWKGALSHLLPPHGRVQKVVHHAAVPYAEVPALVARLGRMTSTSAKALRFTVLTASRTGETIGALWSEIDLKARLWTIPAERMKAGVTHRVPLSDAAIELLKSLPRDGALVFPGSRRGKPLSNMSMLMCLRGLRTDAATVHGLRSSFRDWCAEATNHPREIVEQCLAHATGSAVELAYLRSDHLAKRKIVMAEWATFCAK